MLKWSAPCSRLGPRALGQLRTLVVRTTALKESQNCHCRGVGLSWLDGEGDNGRTLGETLILGIWVLSCISSIFFQSGESESQLILAHV